MDDDDDIMIIEPGVSSTHIYEHRDEHEFRCADDDRMDVEAGSAVVFTCENQDTCDTGHSESGASEIAQAGSNAHEMVLARSNEYEDVTCSVVEGGPIRGQAIDDAQTDPETVFAGPDEMDSLEAHSAVNESEEAGATAGGDSIESADDESMSYMGEAPSSSAQGTDDRAAGDGDVDDATADDDNDARDDGDDARDNDDDARDDDDDTRDDDDDNAGDDDGDAGDADKDGRDSGDDADANMHEHQYKKLKELISSHQKKLCTSKSSLAQSRDALEKIFDLQALNCYNEARHRLRSQATSQRLKIARAPPRLRHALKAKQKHLFPTKLASENVAHNLGKGGYYARHLRYLANHLLRTKELPENRQGQGAYHESLLNREDVREGVQRFARGQVPVEEGGWKGQVRSLSLTLQLWLAWRTHSIKSTVAS